MLPTANLFSSRLKNYSGDDMSEGFPIIPMTPFIGLVGHENNIENTAILFDNRDRETLSDVSEQFNRFFDSRFKIISQEVAISVITGIYKSPIYDLYKGMCNEQEAHAIPMQNTQKWPCRYNIGCNLRFCIYLHVSVRVKKKNIYLIRTLRYCIQNHQHTPNVETMLKSLCFITLY